MTQAFSGQIGKIAPDVARSAKRIAVSAILGGATSALTGGKFANGAITGAFSFAFNQKYHDEQTKEYNKYVINDESAVTFEYGLQFEESINEMISLSVDEGGLTLSSEYKVDQLRIGIDSDGSAYWKVGNKTVNFDIPNNTASFMISKGFKYMSISGGMKNADTLMMSMSIGGDMFKFNAKLSVNLIGATLRSKYTKRLLQYRMGSNHSNKQMCDNGLGMCN